MNESTIEFLQATVDMRKQMKGPEGWPYTCMEDFVLKNGKEFKHGNTQIEIPKGTPKECFKNAFELATDHLDELIYVEGFAFSVMLPMLHAWVVDSKGTVIDPTWTDGSEYFGVPFDFGYVSRTICERGKYGVIDNMEMGFPLLSGEHKDF